MPSVVPELERAGWSPVVDDRFAGPVLDESVWLPHYLPQWSTRERSAARYRLTPGGLELCIEDGQPAWSEELDGPLRVSSLQTGVFAGPLGSRVGQHRVHAAAVVTEEWAPRRLFTPTYAAVVLDASWVPHPDRMVALWLIGFEDEPTRSAEICVAEIFGREAGEGEMLVGMGLHPFGDPAIVDDFEKVRIGADVREPHEYAAAWLPGEVRFFVDGRLVKRSGQAPGYPMQVMLNIYDFGGERSPEPATPFVVSRFRAFAPPA